MDIPEFLISTGLDPVWKGSGGHRAATSAQKLWILPKEALESAHGKGGNIFSWRRGGIAFPMPGNCTKILFLAARGKQREKREGIQGTWSSQMRHEFQGSSPWEGKFPAPAQNFWMGIAAPDPTNPEFFRELAGAKQGMWQIPRIYSSGSKRELGCLGGVSVSPKVLELFSIILPKKMDRIFWEERSPPS